MMAMNPVLLLAVAAPGLCHLLAFTASDLNVFTLALFAASFRSVAGALFSCCCCALLVPVVAWRCLYNY